MSVRSDIHHCDNGLGIHGSPGLALRTQPMVSALTASRSRRTITLAVRPQRNAEGFASPRRLRRPVTGPPTRLQTGKTGGQTTLLRVDSSPPPCLSPFPLAWPARPRL